MKLSNIRTKIDKIDRELLVLLHERMGLALQSTKFKKNIQDTKREEAILKKAQRLGLSFVEDSFSRQLLNTIISESKRLQKVGKPLVAFQGEPGAYSEVASRELVPKGAFLPCMEFHDVFNGVEEGIFDYGVVPVENSLEGTVTQVNDLLTTTNLKIVGEKKIKIEHCLVAVNEKDYREIRVVYSHPQALAQCRNFIMRNNLESRPYFDTAGAAKMLARQQPKASAAIASKLAAQLYDLSIVKENIADGDANSTRFLLLAKKKTKSKGEKCSIIFATPHKAGKLFDVLKLFADMKINLTRIASMPRKNDPGNYTFFLDFEGAGSSEKIKKVLKEIKKHTIQLKFLGSYPKS